MEAEAFVLYMIEISRSIALIFPLSFLVLCCFAQSSGYPNSKIILESSQRYQSLEQDTTQLLRVMKKHARTRTGLKGASLDVVADDVTKAKDKHDFNWKKSLEVSTYLGLWYLFSGYYNIYNKRALTILKLPW